VPRYREINPGLFTVATFPFLFGVMFGDIAHGLLFFIFGSYLCYYAEDIKKKTGTMLYEIIPFRYLIIMMGFFAFYCGLIYNDMTSISLNLFGSCYDPNTSDTSKYINNVNANTTDILRTSNDCVYPFGIDPIWSIS